MRLRVVQRSERSRDGLVGVLVIQLGTAVTDDAHLEDRQIVHLDGVTHQRLLTRTLHEVAEDTLDGAFRERRVVLGHVLSHHVNVERFLVAHARIVLAVGLAGVVVVF